MEIGNNIRKIMYNSLLVNKLVASSEYYTFKFGFMDSPLLFHLKVREKIIRPISRVVDIRNSVVNIGWEPFM